MSSKRRKILQSKKPSKNAQQLIAEGVREVTATVKRNPQASNSVNPGPAVDQIAAAISNDPAVVAAFREEVKATASQRVNSDADFDAEKFPSSSKAFK
jgi:large proline-rich protein BAG6